MLLGGGVLGEGCREGVLGKPDQAMAIGGQLRRQRVRLGAIEHVADRLALIRGEGGDIDERLDLLAAGRRDDGAGIGVADQHDGAVDPLQRPIERGHIVGQGGQRQGGGEDRGPFGLQRADHLAPTRSVGPSTMGEHHAHIPRGHLWLLPQAHLAKD